MRRPHRAPLPFGVRLEAASKKSMRAKRRIIVRYIGSIAVDVFQRSVGSDGSHEQTRTDDPPPNVSHQRCGGCSVPMHRRVKKLMDV